MYTRILGSKQKPAIDSGLKAVGWVTRQYVREWTSVQKCLIFTRQRALISIRQPWKQFCPLCKQRGDSGPMGYTYWLIRPQPRLTVKPPTPDQCVLIRQHHKRFPTGRLIHESTSRRDSPLTSSLVIIENEE